MSIQLKLLEASNSMLQQEREDIQQALNDALILQEELKDQVE